MAEEVVGTIVLIVDGIEHDCVSCNAQETTGLRPVPTMNRKMRTKYISKGVKGFTLSVETVIPIEGLIDWSSVTEARISIESPDGSFRETYVDCFPQDLSLSSNVDGNTGRSISLFALDKIIE